VDQLSRFIQRRQLWGSAASALLFVLFKPFINEFALFFAQVPLFYTALQFEILSLGVPVLLALVFVFLLGGLQDGYTYTLFVIVPVLLLCKQALLKKQSKKGKIIWCPVGHLVSVLTLLGFVYVILLTLLENTVQLTAQIQQAFHQIQEFSPPGHQSQYEQLVRLLRQLIPYFPGISAVGLLTITIGAGALGQFFLTLKNKLMRPPLSLADLYLPWWCWKVLALLGLSWVLLPGAVFYRYLAANLILVLLFSFLLQGLAIAHTYIKKQTYPQLFLVIVYLVMILFSWPIFIFIVLGALEPWVRLRERLKAT
jgi:uncharacterized protein YybS (DUF2232 family)